MDLHAVRLDQPATRPRRRDARGGRVPHLPHAPRARGGRTAGALARATDREKGRWATGLARKSTRRKRPPTNPSPTPPFAPPRWTDSAAKPKVKKPPQTAITATNNA